jgi:hypothetical protein
MASSSSAMASLSRLVHGLAAAASNVLTRPPPATWDPTMVTIRRWTKRFQDVWATQGLAVAYNKLRMENQLRAGGQLMGTDANGNRCPGLRPQLCARPPACLAPTPCCQQPAPPTTDLGPPPDARRRPAPAASPPSQPFAASPGPSFPRPRALVTPARAAFAYAGTLRT